MLLMAEMALFMFLVLPMPFAIKRRLFTYGPSSQIRPRLPVTVPNMSVLYSFISENPLVAKLQYGMKITFIFILILFIDSVNRVYRVQVELAALTNGGNNAYVLPDLSFAESLPRPLPLNSDCSTRQRIKRQKTPVTAS